MIAERPLNWPKIVHITNFPILRDNLSKIYQFTNTFAFDDDFSLTFSLIFLACKLAIKNFQNSAKGRALIKLQQKTWCNSKKLCTSKCSFRNLRNSMIFQTFFHSRFAQPFLAEFSNFWAFISIRIDINSFSETVTIGSIKRMPMYRS